MDGETTLKLLPNRVAKFGTGETGVWGVKSKPSPPGTPRRSGRGNHDGSFDTGVALEIEVTEGRDGPVVVYSIPLTTGRYQPSALRLGVGSIKYLPTQLSVRGRVIGECEAGLEMGRGIVDKGWAKGRKWWWKGTR